MSPEEKDIRQRLHAAYESFLDVYARRGAFRHHGWTDYVDEENFKGLTFWTEADCQLRFAMALEARFPGSVHLEFPLVRWSLGARYDAGLDKKQFVDIVVSDLRDFVEDGTSQDRFQRHCHRLFLEVKFIPHGCRVRFLHDHVRKVDGIRADAKRLAENRRRDRCLVPAVLVVDDEDLFEEKGGRENWPEGVELLLASPGELKRLGLGA